MEIRLTETHLNRIVFNILNGETNKKKKLSFTEKFEKLIEFHVKYHKGLYNLYGNYSEFEKNKKNYLNNLFPDNHKIIKECRLKFPNNIVNESKSKSQIDDFFMFIKESYLKEINKNILSEQQKPTQPQKQLTPQQVQAAKAKIQASAKKQAEVIYKELLKSLDMDGDKDLKDYDGTNEGGALDAIKKIKNRETLDALNKRIALTKQYPNLKAWLNAEMSDFDSEYGAIWAKLEKMGYAGANRNVLLQFAGQTGVGQLVKAADKGIDFLRTKGIAWFMDGLRSALNSGAGQAVQIFLDSFGVGAIANAAVWGIMVIWDLLNINTQGWGLFLLSVLSLLTVGAMAPVLAPLGKIIGGIKGGLNVVVTKLMSSKFGQTIARWIPKIMNGVSKAASWIGSGVKWLVEKFSLVLPRKWVTAIEGAVEKAIGWVGDIVKNLSKYSGHEASDTVLTSNVARFSDSPAIRQIRQELLDAGFPGVERLLNNPKWASTLSKLDKPTAKLVDDYIHNNIRKYGWAATEQGVCTYMGKSACYAVKKIGISFKLKNAYLKATTKSQSALNTQFNVKTQDEIRNMTKAELDAYRKELGKQTQKVVKDTQKATKAGAKVADYASQTALADVVTNAASQVPNVNPQNLGTGMQIAGDNNQQLVPKPKQTA